LGASRADGQNPRPDPGHTVVTTGALADLTALPLGRAPHRALLARCWDLRDDLTIYHASYVALAEALEVTLLGPLADTGE
jgi:predicted nucleic acid-binding protein